MTFIDSHAHLCAEQFQTDWQNIVQNAQESGVSTIINISDNLQEAKVALQQSAKSPIVFTTIGIQPECTDHLPADWFNNLRRLILSSPKVVGIGEIGLDTTLDQPLAQQLPIFNQQIELATELNLPVVIHTRDHRTNPANPSAFSQIIDTLKHYPTLTGVFHCWTGTPDQATQALDLGFYLSFSGIITYPSAGHILEVAAHCPTNRLLIETDAPYLTPEPLRSNKSQSPIPNPLHPIPHRQSPDHRCKPEYVTITGKKLASLRGTTLEDIAATTSVNARTLFKLPNF